MRPISFFSMTAVFLVTLAMPLAKTAVKSWKPARVISTGMHAYGSRSNAGARMQRTEDIWWSYCITSEDRTYSVLSREKPARTGMKENARIKIIEKRNEIEVLNTAGRRFTLKLLRKGQGQECP